MIDWMCKSKTGGNRTLGLASGAFDGIVTTTQTGKATREAELESVGKS